MPDIRLRPATLADADLLLAWRNDPATRAASRDGGEVARPTHLEWLAATLASESRQLYVCEQDGRPVGTLRCDWSGGECELSWTVAPEARGRGIGQRCVALLAAEIAAPLRATVKAGNDASARIAMAAGMVLEGREGDLLRFRRPPRS